MRATGRPEIVSFRFDESARYDVHHAVSLVERDLRGWLVRWETDSNELKTFYAFGTVLLDGTVCERSGVPLNWRLRNKLLMGFRDVYAVYPRPLRPTVGLREDALRLARRHGVKVD